MKRYCGLLVGERAPGSSRPSPWSQSPAPTPDPLVGSGLSPRAVAPAPPPSVTAKPETAKEKSIDELLARLDAIKAQQEELERDQEGDRGLARETQAAEGATPRCSGVTVEEAVPPQPSAGQLKPAAGNRRLAGGPRLGLTASAQSPSSTIATSLPDPSRTSGGSRRQFVISVPVIAFQRTEL